MFGLDGYAKLWLLNSLDYPEVPGRKVGPAQQALLSVDSDFVNPSIQTFEQNLYKGYVIPRCNGAILNKNIQDVAKLLLGFSSEHKHITHWHFQRSEIGLQV